MQLVFTIINKTGLILIRLYEEPSVKTGTLYLLLASYWRMGSQYKTSEVREITVFALYRGKYFKNSWSQGAKMINLTEVFHSKTFSMNSKNLQPHANKYKY